jgi:DNA modification methylase
MLVVEFLKFFKWADVWHKSHSTGFLNAKIMPLRQHEDVLVFAKGRMLYNPQIQKKNSKNIRPHGDVGPSSNYGEFNQQRKRSIALDETYPRSIFYYEKSQRGYHVNEKPISLFSYLVLTYSDIGNTILDPFIGSGTTLVAAKDSGRIHTSLGTLQHKSHLVNNINSKLPWLTYSLIYCKMPLSFKEELMKPYYEHKGITIYHGDCLEIMPELEPVDLVLTDPPYGIKRDKGFEGFGGFSKPIARRRFKNNGWDNKRPAKTAFDLMLSKSRSAMIFGGNYFADILPQGKFWIVWDKLNTMPTFGDCELIWTNLNRKSVKKITHQYNGLLGKEDARYHPTQKPLALIEKLITDYGGNCKTILDPFMGSGTTIRAAKDLGFQATGIELEEKYCEIAARRLQQEVLFGL